MSELLNEVNKFELDEGFSPKEIKMAIGIASDPRYKGGNMTGATNAIDKIKKGLSDHPKVAAVLRRQNEDTNEAVSPAQQAAIAISKKERGEKPKKEEIDETMEDEFGERKAPKVDPAKFAAFMDKKKKPKRMSSTQKALSSISKKADKMSREETDLDNEDESCYIDEDSESRMKDSAMDALHKLVQSKGSKSSLGSHAFEIAKSYGNLNGRELEKMYVDKYGMPEEDVRVIEGYFPEGKSSTGYELYHKTLGGAIDTAVSHAKSKFGISISDEERMDKVGMGPRKPSNGKTNSYRLMGTDKSGKSKGVQVQVYNMGSKYELNMYKESIDEEVEIDEASQVLSHGGKGQYKAISKGDDIKIMYKGKEIASGEKMDGIFFIQWNDGTKGGKAGKGIRRDTFRDADTMVDFFAKKKITESDEIDEAISMKGSVMQYYYVDPKGVVQAVGSKDAMRKMNVKQAKDGNKGGSFSQNLKKYKVGDKIKEEIELDEMFDYAIIDGDNKIIGLYKGKDAKKHAQLNLKGAEKQLSVKKPVKIAPVSKKKVGDTVIGIGEEVEIDESSKEGTIRIIDLARPINPEVRKQLNVANAGNKGYQVQRMTKGKFVNQGKPYKSAKDAEKVRKSGQHSMQFETIEDANALAMELGESVKFAGMPAGLSKARIKADRDVYAQVLGIKEEIDPADLDIKATMVDRAQADNNIMIQLRKVISLRNAHKGVVFADGSKQKVNPNVAAAAITMQQKLRRTDEKDAFQKKISKSYKDLLNAVKGK